MNSDSPPQHEQADQHDQVTAEPTRGVRWRWIAFAALVVVYVILTLGIMYKTPILTFDGYLRGLNLRARMPDYWKPIVANYVAFGQRGPATLVFLPFFIWIAWRRRSAQPLVLLATALIVLNLSVGVVKIITGRLGPLATHNTHAIFVGGNIYPSGHVSNAVVLYGLMAWITMEYRKTVIAVAVFLSVTVGAGTVYLNTHWFSDVVGGWIAGGLVLLALPWVMPTAERFVDRILTRVRARRAVRRSAEQPTEPRGPKHALPSRSGRAITPRRGSVSAFSDAGRAGAGRQGKVTPVRSAARSQSFAATAVSFDAPDESTRRGEPRSSAMPFGP